MLKESEEPSLMKYKSISSNKLGQIFWQKNKPQESIKYMNEYFELNLKMIPKNRNEINQARISLGIVKGLENYLEFIDFLHMSKNRVEDVIDFKKNGNFC